MRVERMIFEGFRRADRAYFDRPVLELAPLLLGGMLVRRAPDGTVGIRLTEVEAYAGPLDPGSHAYRGRTVRNATMFGEAGHLYCYFSYGMHHALNVVCDAEGTPTGCLLRAGEVVIGRDAALRRRSVKPRVRPLMDAGLARGPGNLGQALGADRSCDGADLCDPSSEWSWWLPDEPPSARLSDGRVGVSGEGGDPAQYPWRFWLPGEPSVSAYRVSTRPALGEVDS